MRLLKLVGKIKKLQVIVLGLGKGISSVTYIIVLLFLVYYLFAVLGVGTFRRNDPFHFGSIGVAMMTLFRMSTLDGWSVILYLNYFGCNSQHSYADGVSFHLNRNIQLIQLILFYYFILFLYVWEHSQWYSGNDGNSPYGPPPAGPGKMNQYVHTALGNFPASECWSPSTQPLTASVFCVVFVLISAYVMLSLFIGAVCGGMNDALDDFKEAELNEKRNIEAKAEILSLNDASVTW